MSIITFKNGLLAADTQDVDDNNSVINVDRIRLTVDKHDKEEILLLYTGSKKQADDFYQWYYNNHSTEYPFNNENDPTFIMLPDIRASWSEFTAYAFTPGSHGVDLRYNLGELDSNNNPIWNDCIVWGPNPTRLFAEGAMRAGASAPDTVKECIKKFADCGGEILCYDILKREIYIYQ